MYRSEQIDVVSRAAHHPVTLPMRILVCLKDQNEPFDPFRMMLTVFGRWAENRARKVFDPSIYAPNISRDVLINLFGSTGTPGTRWYLEQMKYGSWQRFDIVHMVGPLKELAHGLANSLALGSIVRSARARLLILQTLSEDFDAACQLGRDIVVAQGPTVLVAAADPRQGLPDYLTDVYAGIVHNESLARVAEGSMRRNVDVCLLIGREGENLLRLDPIRRGLEERFTLLDRSHSSRVASVEELGQNLRLLHESQRASIEDRRSSVRAQMEKLSITKINDALNSLNWSRESRGAIPLAETMQNLDAAEAESGGLDREVEETRQDLFTAAVVAPRVLNANFADANGKLIEPTSALLPESDYDLLVDIGPRWDTIPSLVAGNAEFPEASLPPTKSGGTQIRIVTISDDFSPRIASVLLYLPTGSGRSRPWEARKLGPARLGLRTPKVGDHENRARLRLSVYYEGNLLQSGVVCATIQSTENAPFPANSLVVDYVLSGTFQELPEAFGQRNLALPGRKADQSSIAVNLTLNDDGAGGHRVVILAEGAPEAAFLPYDPVAGKEWMARARKSLLGVFYEKTDRGVPTETPGLQSDNGKKLPQFKQDLYVFAVLGRQLLQGSFGNAQVEGKPTEIPITYLNSLESKIADASLIQVARTGPAQYVFPWGLLYSHPLTGDPETWQFCSVIDEQWIAGRRTGEPLSRCPHQKAEGDHENLICPFGFWGLRHIIEQPLSALVRGDGGYALSNAISTIAAGAKIRVALARTSDATMAILVDAHLAHLALNATCEYSPPKGATTATEAANVFQESELVYILCHGKYDSMREEPYLGIGINDSSAEHRIYPTTLQDWGTKRKAPTISAWPRKRPLVIVNGCHTCDLLPGQMLNIVSALNGVGAGGVVGTEVSVQLPVAVEMANNLFRYLLPSAGLGVGAALHRARWDLANKGNLLGLAYTAYCRADLRLVTGAN